MDPRLGCLDDLPRARLGHAPTPLEAMANLSLRLDSGDLYVKRDDCTGLAFGGNKVRQLEFYLGEAVAARADTVLITGAVQSNFVRLTVAAARVLGMDCHVQLEERVPKNDPVYRNSGNVLLDRILGATVHAYGQGEDEAGADARIREISAELAGQGRRPYVIPLAPGHKPLGALGYVVAAAELLEQMRAQDLTLDEIFVASGSGNTHAGLLFGLRALGCPVRITGICVRRAADIQHDRIARRCRDIADLLKLEPVVREADIILEDDFLAPGYGQLNEAALGAINLAARTEALILDPVYTGKTLAGLIRRAGEPGDARRMLFVHTGGGPAVFAYGDALARSLEA